MEPDLTRYLEAYKNLDTALSSLREGDPASLLITFPRGTTTKGLVVCKYNELTAYCPWTKFPDQGSIEIEYEPGDVLLELKSLKYYLLAFRDRHITQEHLAQKIYTDLQVRLKPGRLKVVLDYMPRGGIHTTYTLG